MIKAINPDVKVILLSGFIADGRADDMVADGMIALLMKPYSVDELFDQIDLALAV